MAMDRKTLELDIMYRNNDIAQNVVHINFIFDDVGIGDSIAALPALKFIHDNHPHVIAHIWVPDYFLEICKRSLPASKNFIIRPLSVSKHKYNPKYPGRSFKLFNYVALATHPTDTAFLNFVNKIVDNSQKNYLHFDTSDQNIKQFNLPEKYVVIPVAYTTEVRQFLPEHINKIVDFVKTKGYDIIFLGKKSTYNGLTNSIIGNVDEKIDFSKGINLLDKTSLLESREIIAHSAAIIGLDNGLIHLAGTTNVPIIVGYTTVEPNVRMPYRNDIMGYNCYPVVPPESLDCRFCQSQMNFTLEHDFRFCYYKDNKCTKILSSELYIEQINKIL